MAKPERPSRGHVGKTSLYLEPELSKALRIAAIEEGVPMTRLIERLIREYLATKNKNR
jgi:predicted HicB family RNase H-like nuclease